tara:strand:- start:241 stop:561 length:321 start_codon:yes stop_codon:yes gene_type:complete
MKRYPFPLNDKDFIVEYHKTREGPNGFMCYYKNAATYRIEPLDAWRILGVAKFTDTGKKLKQWCLDMDEQHRDYGLPDELKQDKFFEVPMSETNHSEPNDNTKMVT